VGIYASGITHATHADRIGGQTKPFKDGHFRAYSLHWQCVECTDAFFIGRLFRQDDLTPDCWPSGTRFKSTRTNEEISITYPEQLRLPGMEEVIDEG
jgi:hypothetical protein